MHKYITRTLFAVAMLALAVNNGLDIWQKLKPGKVVAVDPVAVPIVPPIVLPPVVAVDQVGRVPVLAPPIEPVAQIADLAAGAPAVETVANPVEAFPAETTAVAVNEAVAPQVAAGGELSPSEMVEAGKLLMTAMLASVPKYPDGVKFEPTQAPGEHINSERSGSASGFALATRRSVASTERMIETSQPLSEMKPVKPVPAVDSRNGFALRSRPSPKTPEQIAASLAKKEAAAALKAEQVKRNLAFIAARRAAMSKYKGPNCGLGRTASSIGRTCRPCNSGATFK